MDRVTPEADRFYGKLVARLSRFEAEVARLRNPPPTVTPSRPHPQLVDEFAGGTATSGQVGELGWTHVGGTIAAISGGVGHPGVYRLETGAAAGTLACLHVGANTANGILRPGDSWTVRLVWRVSLAVDANTMLRVGVGLSPQANPPDHGCYVEKLLADTTFYGVCRAAGVQTRSQILTTGGAAMAAIAVNQYYRTRIRRLSSTQIGFTVEEVTAGGVITPNPEVVISTNVPTTTAGMQAFFQVHNGAAAASRGLDPDFAELQLNNLTR